MHGRQEHMRKITINYNITEVRSCLNEDDDADGWLDNLAVLIAEEFKAEVTMVPFGTWGGYGETCRDDDVNRRLRDISGSDEWIALLP